MENMEGEKKNRRDSQPKKIENDAVKVETNTMVFQN